MFQLIPLLFACFFAMPATAWAETTWQIRLAVHAPGTTPTAAATVMGQSVTVPLTAEGDGVWSGTLTVPPLRVLPVRLTAGAGVSYAGLERLAYGDQDLNFTVPEGPQPRLQRASQAISARTIGVLEGLRVGLGALWMIGVGWLLLGQRLRSSESAPSFEIRPGLSLALWLGLAVAWTWPAALASNWLMVGRHFDAPGTIWTIGAAHRLMGGLSDPLTAWPMGADLGRLDSFLLVPISWAVSFLDPVRIHGWLQILGVALSAWAAQGFARAVGARAPWTLLAGLGFGFSGLAATALLEGHVYHVVNPWLPLFGLAWWRTTGPDGEVRDGIMASLAAALCWATTGYVGLAAMVLFIGFLSRDHLRRLPVVVGMVGMGIVLAVYGAQYLGGSGVERAAVERLHPITATLAAQLAPTPELDRVAHSLSPVLSAWMLALVVLAPFVLPRGGRWRALGITGGAALILSMLPQLAASMDLVLLRVELEVIEGSVLASALRFPVRLGWAWLLCGGVLAARVATECAPRWGRAGWIVLLLAVLEAFVRVGMPERQVSRYADSTTLHQQVDGPVLDLLPATIDDGENLERWLGNFACMAQTNHGQALAEDCVQTRPRALRTRINAWLVDRLIRGDLDGLDGDLAALGFRGVALHPDLFGPARGNKLASALAVLDAEPLSDGSRGDHILLYRVQGFPGSDPLGALDAVVVPQAPMRAMAPSTPSPGLGRFNGWVALGGWLLVGAVWIPLVRRRRSAP